MAILSATDELAAEVERIRARHQPAIDRARSEEGRTQEWRLALLAKTYLAAKEEAQRAAGDDSDARAERRRLLQRKVFSNADLAGDPASLAISMRDAVDRVSSVMQSNELLELLDTAERIGDESLARAVADRAFQLRDSEVVSKFAEPRPQLAEAIDELWGEPSGSVAIGQHLGNSFLVESLRPAELADLPDYRLQVLADSTSG